MLGGMEGWEVEAVMGSTKGKKMEKRKARVFHQTLSGRREAQHSHVVLFQPFYQGETAQFYSVGSGTELAVATVLSQE